MPLHPAGVLKLVDKEMVEICAEPFIDERSVGVSDNPAEYRRGLAELDAVGLVKIFAPLIPDGANKPR